MNKQDILALITKSVLWAAFMFFVLTMSVFSMDAPNAPISNYFITISVLIGIPVLFAFFLKWQAARKMQVKIFTDFKDFGGFVLPFVIGAVIIAVLAGLYVLLN